MKSQWSTLLAVILAAVAGVVHSFTAAPVQTLSTVALQATVSTVEVCGFKDCRARGGAARLQKLITTVVEEKEMNVNVQKCDCQGECGYGPNVVVDGKIVNGVRGREAVLKILGLEEEEQQQAEA